MLNIGPKASGEVPQKSIDNLRAVGEWLKINGEAIYNTRKWKITHEGPTKLDMDGTGDREKHGFVAAFTPQDFWFTQKKNTVYAIALEYPKEEVLIESFTKDILGEIKSVEMLGDTTKLNWKQTEKGLVVTLDKEKATINGYALKINY